MKHEDYKHGDVVHMQGFGEGVIIIRDNEYYISFDNYGTESYKLELFDLNDLEIILHSWERSY